MNAYAVSCMNLGNHLQTLPSEKPLTAKGVGKQRGIIFANKELCTNGSQKERTMTNYCHLRL